VNYQRGVFKKIQESFLLIFFERGLEKDSFSQKKSRKAPREELIKILPKAALRQKIILPLGT
jgi:hypothetical protein